MRSRARNSPVPSTCPCTMCPPKRPSARRGSSRFTRAPSCMRENDVRFQVSSARSNVTEFAVISTAVRQTPLTAIESPFFSSFARCEAETVRRRVPRCSRIRVTLATSSTMPVNIMASRYMVNGRSGNAHRLRGAGARVEVSKEFLLRESHAPRDVLKTREAMEIPETRVRLDPDHPARASSESLFQPGKGLIRRAEASVQGRVSERVNMPALPAPKVHLQLFLPESVQS